MCCSFFARNCTTSQHITRVHPVLQPDFYPLKFTKHKIKPKNWGLSILCICSLMLIYHVASLSGFPCTFMHSVLQNIDHCKHQLSLLMSDCEEDGNNDQTHIAFTRDTALVHEGSILSDRPGCDGGTTVVVLQPRRSHKGQQHYCCGRSEVSSSMQGHSCC